MIKRIFVYFILKIFCGVSIVANDEIISLDKLIIEEATLFENNPNLQNLRDYNLIENNNNNFKVFEKKTPPSKNTNKNTNNGLSPQKIIPLKKIISNEPQALAWSFLGDKKFANIRFGEKTLLLKENEKYKNFTVKEINKKYVLLDENGNKKKYFYKDSLSLQ